MIVINATGGVNHRRDMNITVGVNPTKNLDSFARHALAPFQVEFRSVQT